MMTFEPVTNDAEAIEYLNTVSVLRDGHFTVMKFTTNWRVGIGTANNREQIRLLSEGRSFIEATNNLKAKLIGEAYRNALN